MEGSMTRARLKSSPLANRVSQQANADKVQERMRCLSMTDSILRQELLQRCQRETDLPWGRLPGLRFRILKGDYTSGDAVCNDFLSAPGLTLTGKPPQRFFLKQEKASVVQYQITSPVNKKEHGEETEEDLATEVVDFLPSPLIIKIASLNLRIG
jgi:hypothetical protein